jgi:LPXTG-motif cell wall-anchored protein
MPRTGAEDSSGSAALLALLGLGAIVASLLIRRRGALQR